MYTVHRFSELGIGGNFNAILLPNSRLSAIGNWTKKSSKIGLEYGNVRSVAKNKYKEYDYLDLTPGTLVIVDLPIHIVQEAMTDRTTFYIQGNDIVRA